MKLCFSTANLLERRCKHLGKIQDVLISKIFPESFNFYKKIEADYYKMLISKNEQISQLQDYKRKYNRLEESLKCVFEGNFVLLRIIERPFETLVIYCDYSPGKQALYVNNLHGEKIVTLYFEIEYFDNKSMKYLTFDKIEIVDFQVSSKYEGMGYGTIAIEELINLARNLKCTEIYGEISFVDYKDFTDENNNFKQYPNDFYKRHGFDTPKETGRIFLDLKR